MSLAHRYQLMKRGSVSRGLTNLGVFSVLYEVTVAGEINKVLVRCFDLSVYSFPACKDFIWTAK